MYIVLTLSQVVLAFVMYVFTLRRRLPAPWHFIANTAVLVLLVLIAFCQGVQGIVDAEALARIRRDVRIGTTRIEDKVTSAAQHIQASVVDTHRGTGRMNCPERGVNDPVDGPMLIDAGSNILVSGESLLGILQVDADPQLSVERNSRGEIEVNVTLRDETGQIAAIVRRNTIESMPVSGYRSEVGPTEIRIYGPAKGPPVVHVECVAYNMVRIRGTFYGSDGSRCDVGDGVRCTLSGPAVVGFPK